MEKNFCTLSRVCSGNAIELFHLRRLFVFLFLSAEEENDKEEFATVDSDLMLPSGNHGKFKRANGALDRKMAQRSFFSMTNLQLCWARGGGGGEKEEKMQKLTVPFRVE